MVARREAILAILAGRSVYEIEELGILDTLADRSIRCAMETACWDLIGRSMRQPLCHLWGGGYRCRIPLAVRLPFGSPDETAHYRLEDDILLESLEVTDGMLAVPQEPGLGIEIDRNKFEQHRLQETAEYRTDSTRFGKYRKMIHLIRRAGSSAKKRRAGF